MIELLRKRRSVRKFKDKKVEEEKVKLLTEAALRSPTSRNKKAWQFIFIDNPELIEELSKTKNKGSGFLSGCPLAIIVCGDESQTDVWVEDCSIASILIQMTAQSIGLGSCWGQIHKRKHSKGVMAEEYVKQKVSLPESYRVESIIGVGYPDEIKEPIPDEELDYEKVVFVKGGEK